MQKYLVTSAVTFALLGCGGGGGSSKTPAPVVKYFDIDFFDVENVNVNDNDKANCQIFGYNGDATEKIIAYRSTPKDNYEIVIHDADGQFIESYTSNNISNTSFRFRQDLVPDNGYISFGKFSESGINHISTFEKSLLPDSFAIYAENKNSNSTCLPTSTSVVNPQLTQYTGYIERPADGDHYFGFNSINQDLDNIISEYSRVGANNPIEFTALKEKPLLAVRNIRSGDELKQLGAFLITSYKQLGQAATPLTLTEVSSMDNTWSPPTDVTLSSAQLFIDGRQYQAPYAYLWQPLTTGTNDGNYSYSNKIDVENYYIKLQGQQLEQLPWSFNFVAQGDKDIASRLTPNNILAHFPDAEQPQLANCQQNNRAQCIRVVDSSSINDVEQRVFIYGQLAKDPNQSIRQVFYTLSKAEIPIMEFKKEYIDGGFSSTYLDASISLLQTQSSSVIDAFLYQHQDLYHITTSNQLTNSQIDYIPLLKNLAAQQEQQDLLKRQPYRWVWLEKNNG